MTRIDTDRLVLRRWRAEDRPAFAALNADPVVMRHFPAPLARAASDELIDRFERDFERTGCGVWVVECRVDTAFLGCVGVASLAEDIVPSAQLEVAWRLRADAWGNGYATEAARAALRFVFLQAGKTAVYALTTVSNDRSVAVMRRLGMRFVRQFEHPRLPVDSPLRRHVLYVTTSAGREQSAVTGVVPPAQQPGPSGSSPARPSLPAETD